METKNLTFRKVKIKSRIAFYTLGCKLNFSETSSILRSIPDTDFIKVDFDDDADVYVVNTCSVTENADNKLKKLIKKISICNPNAFIIVIGCYAQLKPYEIKKIEGVDLILGASEKFKLNNYLKNLSKNGKVSVHSCEIENFREYNSSYSLNDRTRSFLKIQDGCDYKCTYCTIPLARGESRSDSVESILLNAKKISKNGVQEIVLTGVNIGDYGKGEFNNKNHKSTFIDLLEKLDKIDLIKRFRISSIEPNLLNHEIIRFIKSSKLFMPHFHIPLQSGSNKILNKMKRRYLTNLYFDRIKLIKELMPNACIGADVIVGFPNETEKDFNDTFNFILNSPIDYLHVFIFSERSNTLANSMEKSVPLKIRNERGKVLRNLSIKKRRKFYENQIGKRGMVLFESENKKGYINGYTENYIKIRRPWDPNLSNKICNVKLTEVDQDGFMRVDNLITT